MRSFLYKVPWGGLHRVALKHSLALSLLVSLQSEGTESGEREVRIHPDIKHIGLWGNIPSRLLWDGDVMVHEFVPSCCSQRQTTFSNVCHHMWTDTSTLSRSSQAQDWQWIFDCTLSSRFAEAQQGVCWVREQKHIHAHSKTIQLSVKKWILLHLGPMLIPLLGSKKILMTFISAKI